MIMSLNVYVSVCECMYVVVQFHPWFKFSFLLFLSTKCIIMSLKQREIKFEPRIKLNHNIYNITVVNTWLHLDQC